MFQRRAKRRVTTASTLAVSTRVGCTKIPTPNLFLKSLWIAFDGDNNVWLSQRLGRIRNFRGGSCIILASSERTLNKSIIGYSDKVFFSLLDKTLILSAKPTH